jgi:hypothetical protein
LNKYLFWVMVRCFKLKSGRQGHAALLILVLVCFLGAAALLVSRLVLGEYLKAKEALSRQQVVFLTQDVLQCALQQELRQGKLEDTCWQTVLQPGQEKVEVRLTVTEAAALGLRRLQVAASPAMLPDYVLNQLRWSFTRVVRQQAASHALIVAGSLQGDAEKLGQLLCTSDEGAIFPDYAVGDFVPWQPHPLPTPVDLRTYGLGQRLYLRESLEPYRINYGTNIPGEGIVIFGGDLVLEDGVTFNDRTVLFTEGSLTTGANVTLQNTLIFCKGRLSLGRNNKIRGVIFVKKEAFWYDDLILQHAPEAAAPFSTSAYLW